MVLPGESYTYNLQKVEKIYDSQAILLRVSTNNSEENCIVDSRAKQVSNKCLVNHSGLTAKDKYRQSSEPVKT